MEDKLVIDVPTQVLHHYRLGAVVKTYRVSTAANGLGEQKQSFQTPRGWHIIRAKIGGGQPLGTYFIARRPQGMRSFQTGDRQDPILSRILWLSGLEVGKNRLGNCDTMQRYIYIHGTPHTDLIGTPSSLGCIRMRCEDVIALFDEVAVGTKVFIQG